MMFLDSPSQLAPVETWKAYAERLEELDPRDESVIAEKTRAKRIIELLEEPD